MSELRADQGLLCFETTEIVGIVVSCERERWHGGAHTATIDDPQRDPDFTYKVSWWPTEQRRYTMDEGAIIPTKHPPHPFKGRSDRWCETCDLPDRHPVHKTEAA